MKQNYERTQRIEKYEHDTVYHVIRVEYGGYFGIARAVKADNEQKRWQICIYTGANMISYWDGPIINGEGNIEISLQDINNAQNEIAIAINGYIWDPLSHA